MPEAETFFLSLGETECEDDEPTVGMASGATLIADAALFFPFGWSEALSVPSSVTLFAAVFPSFALISGLLVVSDD